MIQRVPLAIRAYRRALLVLPRRFRDERGAAMAAMVAEEWRDSGRASRVMVLARSLVDLLVTAVVERIRPSLGWSDSRPPRTGGGISWLDVRLGFRMLVRYPALTVIGGLSMAFAVWVGASTFGFINMVVDPTLPLPDGDRIVGIRYWDPLENEEELPVADDLRAWHTQLGTIEELGAFRTVQRNLGPGEAALYGEPVNLAVMSPVGFRVARTPALLGRTLIDADAEPDAPPVIVLGHQLWQRLFGGGEGVIGRTVRVGGVTATVVGVMPHGFAFPRDHMAWLPLSREGSSAAEVPIRVFGRLAPGATFDEAQAEAAAMATRPTGEAGQRPQHLRVQVLPYAESLSSVALSPLMRAMLYQVNLYAALFLILVSANVSLLMFARAATREREILLRTALGASRARIVAQLFVEALVLGTAAAAVGLAATAPGLSWVLDRIQWISDGPLPFWWVARLSPTTVAYAGLLTLLAAVVAGVAPALKVTGRGMQARLNQLGAGAGGLRLGGIWTAVIVTQIAATVVFTGVACVFARQAVRSASVEVNFSADRYAGARLELDRDGPVLSSDSAGRADVRRYAMDVRELQRRLAGDPSVAGVTLTQRLPVKAHAPSLVQVDDDVHIQGHVRGHSVFSGAVDLHFFEVMQAPVLSGRDFDSADLEEGARSVIVNASFIDEVLGGRSALGQRIRYVLPGDAVPSEWYEIVGVVRDLVADRTRALDLDAPARAHIYHPLDAASPGTYPLFIVAHIPSGASSGAALIPQAAAAVNPQLRIHEMQTLDRANSDLALIWGLYAYLLMLVSGIALFLSLAGIYAVMSFTVARRRREIGVRVALGAIAPRVIADIFRRPMRQVVTGVVTGCVLAGAVVWVLTTGRASMTEAALLVAFGAVMLGVCALACVGPVVRALRVEPLEALRALE